MDLVIGWNFEKVDGTISPIVQRFDPGGGAALIEDAIIEIVDEVAVSLE